MSGSKEVVGIRYLEGCLKNHLKGNFQNNLKGYLKITYYNLKAKARDNFINKVLEL